jgi:hypothetical protein
VTAVAAATTPLEPPATVADPVQAVADAFDTSDIVTDHRQRVDAEARRAADLRIAASPVVKGPPTWAKLEELAAKAGLRLVGPIRPGRIIASAGIERPNGQRVIGCQAMDWDGTTPETQDKLLRAQIGAALWALGGG